MDPAQNGCGRGGRGAVLQAALQKQVRRPERPEQTGEGPSLGRGAELSRLLAERQPSPLAEAAAPASGRGILGIGRAAFLRQYGSPGSSTSVVTSQTASLSSSAVTAQSEKPASPSPPVKEMGLLQVGKKDFQRNPKEGREGNLFVNYVCLLTQAGKGRYEYHVGFEPQVDSTKIRYAILRDADVIAVIGTIRQFDGMKLYLPHMLKEQVTTVVSKMPTDGTVICVTIKYTGPSKGQDCIQFYNVLFRKIMKHLKLCQFGRNHFDPKSGISIPQHKLEIWPGYITAIQEYDGGVMLNCDSSFRVLRSETARDVLVEISSEGGDFQRTAVQRLVNCVVLTRYNNQTYRVDDIDFSQSPRSTFTLRSGESISYADYYKNHYDITIRDSDQPLLIHRDKPRGKQTEEEGTRLIMLVPELVYMTGLTDEMRADFKIMKDVAAHTRVTPAVRQMAFEKFLKNVNSNADCKKILDDWGLKLDETTVSAKGWLQSPEEIVLKKKAFYANREADWGRELCQDSVICPVDLTNWLVLFTKRDSQRATEFMNMMKRVCPQLGIKVCDPQVFELRDDRTESYLRTVKDRMSPSVQMVVFIFPTSRDDRYSAVKKLCCVEMPVPSQVINGRTIGNPKNLRSVVQKIALQINCKLGGELWSLRIPFRKMVMVVGVDVYHDSTRGGKSVVGFVSSLNPHFTRWFTVCSFQEPGQELADCLRISLLASLREFHRVNHDLPAMIFFYRDGVGDGQLKYVQEYEVEQLTACFSSFGPEYKPSLTVVVVQKKINTRIFLEVGSKNLENPPPGTVLDHTVTRKNMYDFFLVSQHVRQGTVSPTHYIVLSDSSNMTPDKIQRLSYKLTHLYYNWPGTVRVPAPCQYAHKVAYLCGQNIHHAPHPSLADKLFYL